MSARELFRAEKVNKTFGLTRALVEVDVRIMSGEIRGLIGENGSGKSTFSSIAAGIQPADSGTFWLCGEEYHPTSTVDAMDQGVSMVVQEQGTVSDITVAANIFLGKEGDFSKLGIMNLSAMYRKAKEILEDIGVPEINPTDMIDKLSFEERKLVELARGFYNPPKLWIVDETTTALNMSGREILYRLMRRVKANGGSVLFISHDIDEIMTMCDSLTILRDGVITANLEKSEFDEDKIKQLMIGREISGHYYRVDQKENYDDEVVLEAKNLTGHGLKGISLSLHRREILGIGGLGDSGMHELGKFLYGLYHSGKSEVIKEGNVQIKSPSQSVEEGLAYVSKNRDRESMMPLCSIKDNICLPSLKLLSKGGYISRKKEKVLATQWAEKMEVKAESIEQYCSYLSGGNKQKVVLAKWLGRGSDILILDCPTRGIDIGTKAAIYHLIEEMKAQGKSIILISEEMAELIGMSDRILMLRDGKISGEYLRSEGLTEAKLIESMI